MGVLSYRRGLDFILIVTFFLFFVVIIWLFWSFTQGQKLEVKGKSHLSEGKINAFALSPEGKYLAVGNDQRFVSLFSISGKLLWRYGLGLHNGEHSINSVAVSKGGKLVAAGGLDKKIYLFDRHANLLWSYETRNPVSALSLSPNGEYLVAGGMDGSLYFFKERNLSFEGKIGSPPIEVGLLKGGNFYLQTPSQVYFFNQQGQVLWEQADVKKVTRAANGKYLAILTGKRIYLFNPLGEQISKARLSLFNIENLAISKKGKYIAFTDTSKRVAYLVDRSGKQLGNYTFKERIEPKLAISTDGRVLAFSSSNKVYLFDSTKVIELAAKRSQAFKTLPPLAGVLLFFTTADIALRRLRLKGVKEEAQIESILPETRLPVCPPVPTPTGVNGRAPEATGNGGQASERQAA